MQLLFQAEIFVNIVEVYRQVKPKFYCFPIAKTVIGFKFANLLDATYFENLVKRFSFTGKAKSVADDEKKCLGLNFPKMRPGFFGRREYQGWDPVRHCFNLQEMPKSVKALCRKAGIKPKQLKKPETAF